MVEANGAIFEIDVDPKTGSAPVEANMSNATAP